MTDSLALAVHRRRPDDDLAPAVAFCDGFLHFTRTQHRFRHTTSCCGSFSSHHTSLRERPWLTPTSVLPFTVACGRLAMTYHVLEHVTTTFVTVLFLFFSSRWNVDILRWHITHKHATTTYINVSCFFFMVQLPAPAPTSPRPRQNVGVVFKRGRNGAPSRKGCVING